jgi:hypothetical protein
LSAHLRADGDAWDRHIALRCALRRASLLAEACVAAALFGTQAVHHASRTASVAAAGVNFSRCRRLPARMEDVTTKREHFCVTHE